MVGDPRSSSPSTTSKSVHAILVFLVGSLVGFLASSYLFIAYHGESSSTKRTAAAGTGWITTTSNGCSSTGVTPSAKKHYDYSKRFDKDNRWSLIHVYYGDSSHIGDVSEINKDYFESTKWFSQLRQDMLVSQLLRYKRGGYFVDLAANDAVRISNTYALETNFGWNGLCLEPNPRYWSALAYRKCDVVAAVVGQKTMDEVSFRFPNRAPAQGGIVGQEFDNKSASKFGEDQPRFTVTLREVFERFQTPKIIDYLSLDIEGAEEFVMETFPFDQWKFNVLTVERPNAKLRDLLRKNGYILLKQLKKWGETIWVHQSMEESIDKRALNIDTEDYKYRERPISE